MAVTITLTQKRPNTSIPFYNASTDFKALKQEMIDAGTLIDNGGGNNESDLKRTWSITFTDSDSNLLFENDARAKSYEDARGAYNLTNNILETITTT